MALVVPVPRSMNRVTAAVSKQSRVVFFGTPAFAVPSLRRLHDQGWPVDLVVTLPDKPVGRRQVVTPSPVKTAAQELGLDVATPATLKDEEFARRLADLAPDVCVVVAYGKLIPAAMLTVPRLGFVNVHPSLLPLYRGPTPIETAILDGRTGTGVSIMLLDEGMDTGPVLAAEPWTIPSGFDAPACESELAELGAHLLTDTLAGFVQGSVAPQPQDDTRATVTRKFTREDGKLDWTLPAADIVNRIRALAAEPGAWTTVNGKVVNIRAAHLENGVAVPDEVQPEGGKPMNWDAFRRGHDGELGS